MAEEMYIVPIFISVKHSLHHRLILGFWRALKSQSENAWNRTANIIISLSFYSTSMDVFGLNFCHML